jgi:mitochondrial fission protein ELM1
MSTPHACGVRVLVLSNGVTSAERQCVGLLRALWPDADVASHAQLLRVTHQSFPAAALLRRLPAAVHVLAGSRFAGVDVAALAAQADDALLRDGLLSLVVACGRDTVPAAAAVRAASPRAVVAVQLLHPRVPLSAFDLCVVPAHDAVTDDDEQRVHRTLGVLHDFDAASLAAARARWAHALASAPRPLVACLVGAPTANCPFDGAALARDVAALAADVERCGGCLRCAHACARILCQPALSTHPFSLACSASVRRAARRPACCPRCAGRSWACAAPAWSR